MARPPRTRARTASRVAAVQALFQAEQAGDNPETVIDQFVRHRLGDLEGQDGFEDGRIPDAEVAAVQPLGAGSRPASGCHRPAAGGGSARRLAPDPDRPGVAGLDARRGGRAIDGGRSAGQGRDQRIPGCCAGVLHRPGTRVSERRARPAGAQTKAGGVLAHDRAERSVPGRVIDGIAEAQVAPLANSGLPTCSRRSLGASRRSCAGSVKRNRFKPQGNRVKE